MANAIGDIWMFTVVGSVFNQKTMNTFHYRVEDITSPLDEGILADLIAEDFMPAVPDSDTPGWALVDCIPPQWSCQELWVQKLSPTRYRRNSYIRTAAGAYEGETTVPNVAAVITRQGPLAAREQISNLHVGPIDVSGSFADNGVLTTDGTTKLALLAGSLEEDFPSGGGGTYSLRPVIYHAKLAPPGNFHYLDATVVQTTTRVMRRRTVGRGI